MTQLHQAPDTGSLATDTRTLSVVFITQSGNAEWIADQVVEKGVEAGFEASVIDGADLDTATLAGLDRLVVVCATYGEGEIPDDAADFWDEFSAADAPRLDGLQFGVIALGDSIYDFFCQAGKDVDARLEELGGTRVIERVDCDLDFQPPVDEWLPRAMAAFTEAAQTTAPAPAAAEPDAEPEPEPAESARSAEPAEAAQTSAAGRRAGKSPWGRKNPYPARITADVLLSREGSDKEVRHLEVDLGESGLEYQPGDGFSVVTVNDPALVEAIITRLGATGDEPIPGRDGVTTFRHALLHRLEISTPAKHLVDFFAARTGDPELRRLVDTADHDAYDAYLWGRDVLDLLNVDPALSLTPEELADELRPLTARVYSISSSPLRHAGSVHFTVAVVRHHSDGRDRGGACSTHLADRCPDRQIGIYPTPNSSFRLPGDDVPIIMIGPGTGIAPFRAFLHERAARGATGENWLFFGDRHRATDYLYESELAEFTESGLLTRLDLAFSRDQDHKVYVQDRMRENGAELYAWLQRGAYLYVCGDAARMAHDVDDAIVHIVAEHGGLDAAGARDYVDALKADKRYVRDVY